MIAVRRFGRHCENKQNRLLFAISCFLIEKIFWAFKNCNLLFQWTAAFVIKSRRACRCRFCMSCPPHAFDYRAHQPDLDRCETLLATFRRVIRSCIHTNRRSRGTVVHLNACCQCEVCLGFLKFPRK